MCKAGHPGASSHERRARPWPVSPFYGCKAALGALLAPAPFAKRRRAPPLTSPFLGGAAAPSPPPPGSCRSHAASLPWTPSLPSSLLAFPPHAAAESGPGPGRSLRGSGCGSGQAAAGPGPGACGVPTRAASAPLLRGAPSSMRGHCPRASALAPAPLRSARGLHPGPSGRGSGVAGPALDTEPGSWSPYSTS